jgi:hypothetical protein
MEDIRGVRVPFLSVGWNRQFLMMREFGFVYDSSITTPVSDPPFWPYTLDYQIPHKCIGKQSGAEVQIRHSSRAKVAWKLRGSRVFHRPNII